MHARVCTFGIHIRVCACVRCSASVTSVHVMKTQGRVRVRATSSRKHIIEQAEPFHACVMSRDFMQCSILIVRFLLCYIYAGILDVWFRAPLNSHIIIACDNLKRSLKRRTNRSDKWRRHATGAPKLDYRAFESHTMPVAHSAEKQTHKHALAARLLHTICV